MLGGSFITQGNAPRGKKASEPLPPPTPIPTVPSQEAPEPKPKPTFQPRVFSGYIFGLTGAMCYGSSPLMARQAFLHGSSSQLTIRWREQDSKRRSLLQNTSVCPRKERPKRSTSTVSD